MSSFNESVGLGYLKTNAIEFVKYPLILLPQFCKNKCQGENIHSCRWLFSCVEMLEIDPLIQNVFLHFNQLNCQMNSITFRVVTDINIL